MRRLKDAPGAPGHLQLLALPLTQRLFVQRWLELFDWTADVHFQIRPVSLAEAEAEARTAEGFHLQLLKAEVTELRRLPTFAHAMVGTDPVAAAERLAATPAAMLHHPQYLFHAINIFLNVDPPNFGDRIAKLEQGWAGSTVMDYDIYFRVVKLRALPASRTNTRLKLLPQNAVPDAVRVAAGDLFAAPERGADAPSVPVVRISASAREPNSALEAALRTYYDYCACLRAASPALKPTQLDLSAAVIETPSAARTPRRLPIQRRRFQMRGGRDVELFGRLDALVGASPLAATFVRNFGEAIERLREGDADSALEALILDQDLAFHGCRMHNWGYARYLVEIGSKLIALDWPRRYFEYIEAYCRQPSHTVDPTPRMTDRRRARVLLLARQAWPLLTDDQRWHRIMARTAWDSLLAHHRDHFVRSLNLALQKNVWVPLGSGSLPRA